MLKLSSDSRVPAEQFVCCAQSWNSMLWLHRSRYCIDTTTERKEFAELIVPASRINPVELDRQISPCCAARGSNRRLHVVGE